MLANAWPTLPRGGGDGTTLGCLLRGSPVSASADAFGASSSSYSQLCQFVDFGGGCKSALTVRTGTALLLVVTLGGVRGASTGVGDVGALCAA